MKDGRSETFRGGNDSGAERLDQMIAALAADEARAAPQVRPDLMARVLADAGSVSAEMAAQAAAETSRSGDPARGGRFLGGLLDGFSFTSWRAGAAAAMVFGLLLGFGIGFGTDMPEVERHIAEGFGDEVELAFLMTPEEPF